MKKPIKKRPAKRPVKKKKAFDGSAHMSMPGWTDRSDVFGNGAIVQVKRHGRDAHVDIRLPADTRKGSVTFYVQGSVEEAVKWLLANKKKLRYAANLSTETS